MVMRQFAVGDRVHLRLPNYINGFPHDVYTISRRLPTEANIRQYRVQRAQDGQQRVVREDELIMLDPPQQMDSPSVKAVEAQLHQQRIRNSAARVRAARINHGR